MIFICHHSSAAAAAAAAAAAEVFKADKTVRLP
jgi:hypothetical protein